MWLQRHTVVASQPHVPLGCFTFNLEHPMTWLNEGSSRSPTHWGLSWLLVPASMWKLYINRTHCPCLEAQYPSLKVIITQSILLVSIVTRHVQVPTCLHKEKQYEPSIFSYLQNLLQFHHLEFDFLHQQQYQIVMYT